MSEATDASSAKASNCWRRSTTHGSTGVERPQKVKARPPNLVAHSQQALLEVQMHAFVRAGSLAGRWGRRFTEEGATDAGDRGLLINLGRGRSSKGCKNS